MKELKCPKCGNVFTVDESDYADIVNQVKNAEFESELNRRMKETEKLSRMEKEAELGKKDSEIARLQEQLKSIAMSKQLEFVEQMNAKDNEIARLKNEVANKDNEDQTFDKDGWRIT